MSIESVQDADAAQSRPTNMVHKTVRLQPPMAIAQQTQYSDMLLGDMGMMGCDVDAWSRPQQYAPQPQQQQQQQFGFACPPAVLTRHVSMPVAAPRQVTPVQYQQQPATSFAMGMPPTLARHHSHGYVSVMQQQQQGYQTAMNVPMPPRQVHVNEMQHLLEISMGQQQPLQYQQRYMKSEPMSSSSAMNVEPIAFAPADNNAKLAMDDLDPLAYAVFGNATAHKPALPGMPQDIQQIESAFDSLDRLLPEIEQEMLFRSPEMDQFAQSAVTANIKPTTKSPKSMATCKVEGCKKLSRNQGMCTMHIREEKQDSTNFDAPMKAESAVALAV
ncbi:hypothetical protein KRP22_012997 [Phytophthora ramorum]|nr:hypothetical protein KRP22_8571 [Phytophthora ramorum]